MQRRWPACTDRWPMLRGLPSPPAASGGLGGRLASAANTSTESTWAGTLSLGELLGLGLAGGLVPCWDAVGLIVLATALGRLGTGVILVVAFGAGMAGVLVAVGLLAGRLKAAAMTSGARRRGKPGSSWSAA